MSAFYTDLQAVASKLLSQFGKDFTFTRTDQSVYDPATGTTGPGTITTFTGKGALFDYDARHYDGTTILVGDVRLLVESMNEVPKVGDMVVLASGQTYTVISTRQTAPAEINVTTEVQLRAGIHAVL